MNKILSPVWHVIIAIFAIIITWNLGKNSGKRSANETRDKIISDDLKTINTTKREAVNRDFNNIESLVTELNESEVSKEPLK